ncbi:hypothetical protein GRJ2_002403500 [Grus japonensis]|uniref:Uncharacterized protein n=1 Tax=Grus japonensis TaxID=30415 RepID=A0ABC9XPL4_GRUJA
MVLCTLENQNQNHRQHLSSQLKAQVVLIYRARHLNNSLHRDDPLSTENLRKDAERPSSCQTRTLSCLVPPQKCCALQAWNQSITLEEYNLAAPLTGWKYWLNYTSAYGAYPISV